MRTGGQGERIWTLHVAVLKEFSGLAEEAAERSVSLMLVIILVGFGLVWFVIFTHSLGMVLTPFYK